MVTSLSISPPFWLSREGQKGIVVWPGGSMIKRGVEARKDLEKLGRKVYLDLQVRVQPLWRRDAND